MLEKTWEPNVLKDRLRELREERGLTQKRIAQLLNISASAYGYYEQGKRDPSTESLLFLANEYDCSIDYLLGASNLRQRSGFGGDRNSVPVPIVRRIKAGEPILALRNVEGYEMVSPEESADGKYFYLRASGDSMVNARICAGDLVYVRRQTDAENRDIVIVTLNDEDAVIRRLIKSPGGIILQPESDDPDHAPLFFPHGDPAVHIIGKAIHVKFRTT